MCVCVRVCALVCVCVKERLLPSSPGSPVQALTTWPERKPRVGTLNRLCPPGAPLQINFTATWVLGKWVLKSYQVGLIPGIYAWFNTERPLLIEISHKNQSIQYLRQCLEPNQCWTNTQWMKELGLSKCQKILNYRCIIKHHKIKNGIVGRFTPKWAKEPGVYNHVPSLPGVQIPSGEILEVCPEKQELNQNVPYHYFYLT